MTITIGIGISCGKYPIQLLVTRGALLGFDRLSTFILDNYVNKFMILSLRVNSVNTPISDFVHFPIPYLTRHCMAPN